MANVDNEIAAANSRLGNKYVESLRSSVSGFPDGNGQRRYPATELENMTPRRVVSRETAKQIRNFVGRRMELLGDGLEWKEEFETVKAKFPDYDPLSVASFYKTYWLPCKRRLKEKAGRNGNGALPSVVASSPPANSVATPTPARDATPDSSGPEHVGRGVPVSGPSEPTEDTGPDEYPREGEAVDTAAGAHGIAGSSDEGAEEADPVETGVREPENQPGPSPHASPAAKDATWEEELARFDADMLAKTEELAQLEREAPASFLDLASRMAQPKAPEERPTQLRITGQDVDFVATLQEDETWSVQLDLGNLPATQAGDLFRMAATRVDLGRLLPAD